MWNEFRKHILIKSRTKEFTLNIKAVGNWEEEIEGETTAVALVSS